MAVIKEWVCMAHGDFDGPDAVCPSGCMGTGMIQRAFRTAPAIQSAGYRSVNASMASLAAEHGLSDMATVRPGEARTRVTYEQRRRTSQQSEMLGHGDNGEQDMGAYFKPLGAMGQLGAQPPSLVRDAATGRVVATDGAGNTVASFAQPKVHVAGRHDGTKAGLPAGDA